MTMIARIVGISLLTGGMAAVLGVCLLGSYSDHGPEVLFGTVGAIVGAIAGAAREIAVARSSP